MLNRPTFGGHITFGQPLENEGPDGKMRSGWIGGKSAFRAGPLFLLIQQLSDENGQLKRL